MMNSTLSDFCNRYTSLDEADIQELERTAINITESHTYDEFDVFLDVYNDVTNEALVVFHKKPVTHDSLYKLNVVGQDALKENEPGVLRTLETSLNSVGLLAKTQEEKLIQQRIYPVRNQKRTIAVLILEEDISKDILNKFDSQTLMANYDSFSSALHAISQFDESVVNQMVDGLFIFNQAGVLRVANKSGIALYKRLGYLDDIIGLHYDNLTLDGSTFEYVMYQKSPQGGQTFPLIREISYLGNYFSIKKIWIDEAQELVLLIQDVTEIHQKDAEIISKTVAIKEIHHRVKNNLQSVVSLLRIQERRTDNQEAKKILRESVSRVMAIAATHELLSKQIDDDVSLAATIEAIVYNYNRLFQDSRSIVIMQNIDSDILIDSNRMVTLSLIVNELVQNVYDHAFTEECGGLIEIEAHRQNGDEIVLSVTDNGQGYDLKKSHQNSLGLMIVESYVKDKLKGKLKTKSGVKGTEVKIRFEL